MNTPTAKMFNQAVKINLPQQDLLELYKNLKELNISHEDLIIYKKLLEDMIQSAQSDKNLITYKCFGICNALMNSIMTFNQNYNTKLNTHGSYDLIKRFSKHFYNMVSIELLDYAYPIPKSKNTTDLWSNNQLKYRIKFMQWIVTQIDEMLQYNV